MRQFALASKILFLLAFCPPFYASANIQSQDLMTLQPWPAYGPWFEGWYIRVTDPEKNISFAVISTTATHETRSLSQGPTNLPGYQAFIADLGNSEPARVEEAFPTSTSIQKQGSDFLWTSENSGTLSKFKYHQRFPSGAEIFLKMKDPKPWRQDGGPPAGWTQHLPLPLKWYVHSLGSETIYEIRLPGSGRVLRGTGYAHVEKNWGSVFPKAWMWAQATDPENTAHLSLAGGPLKVSGLTLTSYMVGFKIDGKDYDIQPGNILAEFKTRIDSCSGTFELVASNLFYRLEIFARAPLSSFGLLAIPTFKGYEKNGAMESFQTEIEVKVRDHFGQVIAAKSFRQAALEFGAIFMKCGNREQ